jgi:hypothetical protein
MGVAAMTAADVRVENHAKPTIPKPPTRLSGCRRPASTGRTWRYRGIDHSTARPDGT